MNTKDHKKNTVTGLKWNLLDKIVSQGVGFAINVLLARLLLPEDFGLLGMVVVIIGFASVFKDFGLGSAIIQKKEITADDLSTVFWFNLGMGGLLTGIIYLSAGAIAGYYALPALKPIAELLSVTYFISALNIVQVSLLRKKMDFRKLFMVNASSTIISGGVAIALALAGWGVWSLVWKMIVFVSVANLVLWLGSNWRPKLTWSKESLKEIMGFSLPLLGTQSLNYWVRNIDNLLIGKYLGDSALGFYNQSYRIMLIPVSQITGVISNVLFPSLAQIQDDKVRIKKIYLKVTKLLSFVTFPLMFGLCALAEPFVQIVLGEKWMPMVPVLRYLSIVGAFQSIGTLNGNIFQATGKTKYQFWVGFTPRLLYVVAIVCGLSGGVESVAAYYMTAVLISSFYMYYFMGRLIDMRVSEVLRSFGGNLLVSILMSGIAYWTYLTCLSSLSLSYTLSFITATCIGVLTYFMIFWIVNREELYSHVSTLKAFKK